jgi:UDP-glucose 4-epimerase
MALKPLVSGADALFHFWPLPRGTHLPPAMDGDDDGHGPATRGEIAPRDLASGASAAPDHDTGPAARTEVGAAGGEGSAGSATVGGSVAGGGPRLVRRAEDEAARMPGEEPGRRALHPLGRRPVASESSRDRLLITGIAGGLGQILTHRVRARFDVAGVDRATWPEHPRHVRVHVLDLRQRKLEDVFRTERPTAVVHMAFVRHFGADPQVRHQVNVAGTRQLLEYCVTYGVRQLVVLSSSYVYGALPDNPSYLTEEAPLNVSRTYPEVRDLAEVDTLCGMFLWRYPEIRTTILRPVNTLGASVHSAIGRYLKLKYIPTVLGFDPMVQFIHERDLAEAVALALETGIHGTFNVTGPGAVPLTVAIRESGGTPVAIPSGLARAVTRRLFRFGLYPFPPGAMDFVKYACTVDGSRFRAATGFAPQFPLKDIFRSVRR